MAPTSPNSAPADGDLVIASDHDGRSVSYVLSVTPSPAQIRYPSYEHALSRATAWTAQIRCTVWFTDDGQSYRLVTSVLDSARRRELIARIQGEYLEMPGLLLTAEQAQRLWALDRDTCRAVLQELVDGKFLVCGPDHRYRRAADGTPQRKSKDGIGVLASRSAPKPESRGPS